MYCARLIVATGIALSLLHPVYAQKIDLPGGGTVTITQSSQTDGGSVKTTEEARGVGASGQAVGDKAELGITGDSPGAATSGGNKATGGSINASGKSSMNMSLWSNPLIWAGILSWLGAAAAIYLRLPIRVAIIAAAAGAAFICAAMFPAAMLFIVGGTAVAGVAFFVWSSHQADGGAKAREALRAVVAGIGKLKTENPEAYAKVKDLIEWQATATDESVIKNIKAQDGIK